MAKVDQKDMQERRKQPLAGDDARERLLAGLPVTERRMHIHGVSTAVLEGGDGPPVVLLHGPGGYAAHWMRVIPGLVATHRVVAPDLPGHGASEVSDGLLDAERVLAWLGELIEHSCMSPPALVGQLLGGAIAARFALKRAGRVSRLVLIDTFGLAPFDPAPEFGFAINDYFAQPTGHTHERLWRHCAFDLDVLRRRMGAALATVHCVQPRSRAHAERASSFSRAHAAVRAARDPRRGPGAHCRSHKPHLGPTRSGGVAFGRRGSMCPLRMAAARD